MTPKNENVAIFNPLVLPLPNWHPDGPDGAIDGFVIPFVFPDPAGDARPANRGAKLRVYPTPHGWRASLVNCQDHAETAEQARAFAAAWIRAAEILENATTPQRVLLGEGQDVDQVVDAEVVDDDEDQDAGTVTQRVGAEIRRLRGKRSALWLSNETAKHGRKISRPTISELETGKRKDVSAAELVALAGALDTTPEALMRAGGDR